MNSLILMIVNVYQRAAINPPLINLKHDLLMSMDPRHEKEFLMDTRTIVYVGFRQVPY